MIFVATRDPSMPIRFVRVTQRAGTQAIMESNGATILAVVPEHMTTLDIEQQTARQMAMPGPETES